MTGEERARAHDQAIASAVSRGEFEKLEGTVQDHGKRISQLVILVENTNTQIQGLVKSVDGMKDVQSSIQKDVAETRAATRPKGIEPNLLIAAVAVMITCLSVGGMLVFQHVNGTVKPLVSDINELRAQQLDHEDDGHPFSVRAELNILATKLDGHLSDYARLNSLQEELCRERLKQMEVKLQSILDNQAVP